MHKKILIAVFIFIVIFLALASFTKFEFGQKLLTSYIFNQYCSDINQNKKGVNDIYSYLRGCNGVTVGYSSSSFDFIPFHSRFLSGGSINFDSSTGKEPMDFYGIKDCMFIFCNQDDFKINGFPLPAGNEVYPSGDLDYMAYVLILTSDRKQSYSFTYRDSGSMAEIETKGSGAAIYSYDRNNINVDQLKNCNNANIDLVDIKNLTLYKIDLSKSPYKVGGNFETECKGINEKFQLEYQITKEGNIYREDITKLERLN